VQQDLEGKDWLGLAIGNSRLHWAWFIDDRLHQTWDTAYFSREMIEQLIVSQFDFQIANLTFPSSFKQPDLWIASVVPAQTELWQSYSLSKQITLEHIPIPGLYATMGIDRALALWGAIGIWGFPVLVIDAGTALTLTGADSAGQFAGGAILPGLQLQLRSLNQSTAALPLLNSKLIQTLPDRWARNTEEAIMSGAIYVTLAGLRDFIEDWWQQLPHSPVILTGGDSALLQACLHTQNPDFAERIRVEPDLIFWGMQNVRAINDEFASSPTS
jgi:type III pantothenate kinase